MALKRWVWAAALWAGLTGAAYGASIDVGSAAGAPGDQVMVAVTLQTMGATVIGTQNRIDFSRDTPIAATLNGDPDCVVNPAIDKGATGFRFLPLGCDPKIDCQSVRVFVIAFDNFDPIDDGSVLYTCHIAIAPTAQSGTYVLNNAEVDASGLAGQPVTTTGSNGSVVVTAVPVASIDVGSTSGPPGSTSSVAVTFTLLGDPPAAVAGVQNDIGFDPLTPIAALPNGRPRCAVNPDIDKGATSFTFLPMACTPGADCTGVRAFVLSTTDLIPLASGVTLYSCDVAIDPLAAPGTYPLEAAMPLASGLQGQVLSALASNGSVEVTQPQAPTCVGDCDDDHVVTIAELLLGVNIVNGVAAASTCPSLDIAGDGTVAINDLVQAVSNALNGCPAA